MESLLGIEITDETDLVADLRQLARERFERKMIEQTDNSQVLPLLDDNLRNKLTS
jgi:hypothetical protein